MLFKPWFLMLVGLPGSCKSTVTWQLMHPGTFSYLSTDHIIETMAIEADKTYSEIFKEAIGPAQNQFNTDMLDFLYDKDNIVHDQTNLSIRKRKSILVQIPKDYYKIALVVTCDEKQRQERLQKRPGKHIPADIDRTMQVSYVTPTFSEGFDDVQFLDTSSK